MEDIIEDILEMIELQLKMAQIALYALSQLYFTQKSMKYSCFITYCRHKTPNLTENSQITNRVQQIELLKRIRIFLNNQYLLLFIQLQPNIIRYPILTLISPYSLQSLHLKPLTILLYHRPTKSNRIVFLHKTSKRHYHINQRNLIIYIE